MDQHQLNCHQIYSHNGTLWKVKVNNSIKKPKKKKDFSCLLCIFFRHIERLSDWGLISFEWSYLLCYVCVCVCVSYKIQFSWNVNSEKDNKTTKNKKAKQQNGIKSRISFSSLSFHLHRHLRRRSHTKRESLVSSYIQHTTAVLFIVWTTKRTNHGKIKIAIVQSRKKKLTKGNKMKVHHPYTLFYSTISLSSKG